MKLLVVAGAWAPAPVMLFHSGRPAGLAPTFLWDLRSSMRSVALPLGAFDADHGTAHCESVLASGRRGWLPRRAHDVFFVWL